MIKEQTIYVILNDLEEIIDIKSTEAAAQEFIKQNSTDYDDYEIETRKLDINDQQPFKTLYVVNCEIFADYDDVSSSLFTEEQDARNYYFEKIKEFKADCEEDMDEFPYIEKENEVQLEECFIVNFSQYNLD